MAADQEVHSRDLVLQKMTRDGLVEENKTKGTSNHISNRDVEQSFDGKVEDTKFGRNTESIEENERKERIQYLDELDDVSNASTDLEQESLNIKELWEQGADYKQYLSNSSSTPVDSKKDGLKKRQEWIQSIKKREQGAGYKEYFRESPDVSAAVKKDGLKRRREWEQNLKSRESSDWKLYLGDSRGPKIKHQNIKLQRNKEHEVPFTKEKEPQMRRNEKVVKSNTYKRRRNTYDSFNTNGSFVKNKLEQEVFKRERDNVAIQAVHRGYRSAVNIRRNYKRLKGFNETEHKFKYLKSESKREINRRLKQKLEEKLFEEKNDNVALKATYLSYRAEKAVGNRLIRGGKKKTKKVEIEKEKRKQGQKKRNKKIYAKEVKSKAAEFNDFVGNNLKAAVKKLLQILATHKASLIMLCLSAMGGMLLYIFIIGAGISFMQIVLSEVILGTYQTDYGSMTDCDSIFKNLEARLEERINNIEVEFPGYDEYRYELGKIGHDPNLLLAYLGAKFQGFTPEIAEEEIIEIFNLMYELDLTEEIEIRTRVVEKEDPITGEMKEVVEEYEYYILHVTLNVKNLKNILEDRLSEEEKKQFEIYQSTGGGQNIYPNPLDFDWHNSITSQFGYRIHPISGDLKFHSGVDIAAPKGSPIFSSMEGTVIKAGENGGYGLSVEIQNVNGDRTRYAHCSKLLVSTGQEVKRKDKIAEVGSTGNSTGNHLHFEFINADGTYLNPLFIISNFNKEKQDED